MDVRVLYVVLVPWDGLLNWRIPSLAGRIIAIATVGNHYYCHVWDTGRTVPVLCYKLTGHPMLSLAFLIPTGSYFAELDRVGLQRTVIRVQYYLPSDEIFAVDFLKGHTT